MSIVWLDCDGKTLRVGDRFKRLNPRSAREFGKFGVVVSPSSCGVMFMADSGFLVRGFEAKRVDSDDKPCGQSFEELMGNLKRGAAA